jgi:hypothetical protein
MSDPTIPGYYVTALIRTDNWPYATTSIVGGPYRDPPTQVNENEKIRYWNGTNWTLRGLLKDHA